MPLRRGCRQPPAPATGALWPSDPRGTWGGPALHVDCSVLSCGRPPTKYMYAHSDLEPRTTGTPDPADGHRPDRRRDSAHRGDPCRMTQSPPSTTASSWRACGPVYTMAPDTLLTGVRRPVCTDAAPDPYITGIPTTRYCRVAHDLLKNRADSQRDSSSVQYGMLVTNETPFTICSLVATFHRYLAPSAAV